MKAYSRDLRERILRAVDAGQAKTAIAVTFSVSRSMVTRLVAQRRETGDITPRRPSGRPPKLPRTAATDLAAQVTAAPDATLPEYCAAWAQTHGVRVHPSTMSRALSRLGLPRKKRPFMPRSRTRRPGPPGARRSRS